MAIDVRTNYAQQSIPGGRIRHLLEHILFWVRDVPLTPVGFIQLDLGSQVAVPLLPELTGGMVSATYIVVNVEGASIRYCDSAMPTPSYGELYTAGTAFSRALRDMGSVYLCGTAAGSIANISLYRA